MGLENPLHILIILAVVLMLFGAKRLPEMGKGLGSGIRGFKEGLSNSEPPAEVNPAPADPVQHAPVDQVQHTPVDQVEQAPAAGTASAAPESDRQTVA